MDFQEQEQAKEDAFVYPDIKKLYVGLNHKCGEESEGFVSRRAYFSGKLLTVRECKKCGECFITHDCAKTNSEFLQQYILVDSQTNKRLRIPYFTKNIYSPRSNSHQKKKAEATLQEQWAAKHPYQGGGFSSK